jgi:hypothetical protein
MILSLLLAASLAAAPGAVLSGVARTDDGLPIPGVSVVVDDGASTTTDSAGTYTLSPIAMGSHTVRFSRTGYRPLTLTVLVGEGSSARVDVTLSLEAVALDAVRVVSRRPSDVEQSPDSRHAPGEPGSWRSTGFGIRESARLAEADVLRALAQTPAVQMQPESPTTLHVRGGSGDETLVLLDGIPLENTVHASDVLSAVNPDAVANVSLSGGATSARYGGKLSGVVSIRSVEPRTDVVRTHGTLSPTAASGLVELPLARIGGGAILSLRHSSGDVLPTMTSGGSNDGPNAPAWHDVFAKITARIGGGTMSALALSTHDNFLFDARTGAGSAATTPDTEAAAALDAPQNRFDWTASAHGLAWERPIRDGTFAMHLWRSTTTVAADWASMPGPVYLSSSLVRTGGSAEATWERGNGHLATGIQVDRISTEYAVSPLTGAASWSLAARPTVVAAFLERRWAWGKVWETTVGLRAPSISGSAPQLEPRLLVMARMPGGITASAGYARSHQYVQSLRNEESLLDAIIGVSLPSAVGMGGVPVARADALSAGLTVPLPASTRLTLEGYTRWLDGLVLVAPATSEAFAMSTFVTGSGRASGLGATVVHDGERLSWDVSYALAAVSRTSDAVSYQPAFAPRSSGSLGATWHASARTRVRLASWIASERRTTAVNDAVMWEWQHSLARRRNISGTPQQYAAPLGTSPLPSYARVDMSVRHDVALGAGTMLIAYAGVQNVFNAPNAFGYALGDRGEQQTLAMMPRALTFGLEWHR